MKPRWIMLACLLMAPLAAGGLRLIPVSRSAAVVQLGVAPMERMPWTDWTGGHHLVVANSIVDPASPFVHVPYIDGFIELEIQRQVKETIRPIVLEQYRISARLFPVRRESGCCGGGDAEPIAIANSEPWMLQPNEWINDVVAVRIACPAGSYRMDLLIERFQELEDHPEGGRWVQDGGQMMYLQAN